MEQSSTINSSNAIIAEELNLTYLKTISGGDVEFEKDMLESIQTDVEEKMELLAGYVLAGDGNNIRMQAHSLKNLCSIIGVAALNCQFMTMEITYTENRSTQFTAQQFEEINALWQHVKIRLQKAIENY